MYRRFYTSKGFSIVELALVMVILGVLVTVSVVGFDGVNKRTRDAQRVGDMRKIAQALDSFQLERGYYPVPSGNGPGNWEVSSINPSNFLKVLSDYSYFDYAPLDPINNAPGASYGDGYAYAYNRYPAGALSGCPAEKGQFYVLVAWKAESKPILDNSPGFSCGTLNFTGGWVIGRFANQ